MADEAETLTPESVRRSLVVLTQKAVGEAAHFHSNRAASVRLARLMARCGEPPETIRERLAAIVSVEYAPDGPPRERHGFKTIMADIDDVLAGRRPGIGRGRATRRYVRLVLTPDRGRPPFLEMTRAEVDRALATIGEAVGTALHRAGY